MNPLSALRQVMPSFGNLPLSGAEGLANGNPTTGPIKIPMDELNKLGSVDLRTDTAQAPSAAPSGGSSFGNVLGKMVEEVNARQVNAGQTLAELQSGGNVSLHQAVIAMEEASVSFQLMVEVRNKLLESYQEMMRMQV